MTDLASVPAADEIEIRRLGATEVREQLDALAGVLHDCVSGGASVSYMAPFSPEDAPSKASSPRPSRATGFFLLPSPTATWSAPCR